MTRRIFIPFAFVVLVCCLYWFQGNKFYLPEPTSKLFLSSANKDFSVTKKTEYLIPSSLDNKVDLITGNLFKQDKPSNIQQDDWVELNQTISNNWSKYYSKMGEPMLKWSNTEIQSDSKKVFYPFSGPDFTTLYQMFPHADHYVMTAQQRGERLVNIDQLNSQAATQTAEVLGSAWKSFGKDGFFVTEYLFKYISTNKVKIGATTLIASFAHLHGFSIQKIIPISVSQNGGIEELSDDQSWDSVRFYLVKDSREVKIDYVRMDLSNEGMNSNPQNLIFFKVASQSPVLLKAASHLPQHPGFTIIRNEILARSPMIVQDETGLDYYPLSQHFDTVLYGNFVKAYKVFSTYNVQLAKAYEERNDEKHLPFRIGYFKNGNYSLIVAKRKS